MDRERGRVRGETVSETDKGACLERGDVLVRCATVCRRLGKSCTSSNPLRGQRELGGTSTGVTTL